MADPATWTIIAIGLGAVGAAAGAGTAIASGVATEEQNEFNARMAARNAAQQEANAAQQRKITQIQIEAQNAETNSQVADIRRRNMAILAKNRLETGSLGVVDTTGSSLLLAIDNAENAELEALETLRTGRNKANLLQYEGDVTAYNYLQAANTSKLESNQYKAQAAMQPLSTGFNATAGAMQGASAGVSLVSGVKKLNG